MKHINIALDGPAGAGKSYLCKEIAKHYGLIHVDTGALYRAIGLFVNRSQISKDDKEGIISCLDKIELTLSFVDSQQCVMLCGENVNSYIRTPEISMYASAVSAIPEVRAFLLDTQRKIAEKESVIMDGRDIGTVILPNADVKIFLTASNEARAMRRYTELCEKGIATTFEDVLSDIIQRDKQDSTRQSAPLRAADDAVILDNSGLDRQQTVEMAIKLIDENLIK